MPSAMPTATARLASSALQVPPTQNTAQVIEFNCLYTHDIRRKSKRWQDGFLKLHTFNARVLVYDEQRNLVGDTHLTNGKELEDGDEIKLDKGGVLVQVADRRGETTTDITGVCKQKATVNPASSSPLRLPEISVTPRGDRQPLQEKHRSLNALLGPGRKPIGKAVLPTRSPFEIRQEERENFPDREGVKRRRIDRDDEQSSSKSAQMQARAHQRHNRAQAAARATAPPIDLTTDDGNVPMFSSIVPTPATQTPARPAAGARSAQARATARPRHVDQERIGKRLSIAKTNTKRNMLACQDVSRTQTLEEQQRQRLMARLARVEQRNKDAGESVRTARSPTPPRAELPHDKLVAKYMPSRTPSPESPLRPVREQLPSSFEEMEITDDAMETLLEAEKIREQSAHADDIDFTGFDDSIDDELERLATSSTLASGNDMEPQKAPSELALARDLPPVVAENQLPEVEAEQREEALVYEEDKLPLIPDPPPTSSFTHVAAHAEMPPAPLQQVENKVQQPTDPTEAHAQAVPKKTSVRRSKRVGRVDIRKSAAACFKPPTLSTRVSSGPLQLPSDSPPVLSTAAKSPWSREAFDLFTWRPPGWNEGEWRVDAIADVVQ